MSSISKDSIPPGARVYAVRIIDSVDHPVDPARPSWAETETSFIQDHPVTIAGHMINKLYNNTIAVNTTLPTWTYGLLSRYPNITFSSTYGWNTTDHVAPPSSGPVPNTQGVYFSYPKDNEGNKIQVIFGGGSVGYAWDGDIDVRRFWPGGRPDPLLGVTYGNYFGPGGANANLQHWEACLNISDTLNRGRIEMQGCGADCGYKACGDWLSDGSQGTDDFKDSCLWYANKFWLPYLENYKYYSLAEPCPNGGLETLGDGDPSKRPTLYPLEPDAKVWTAGGPDLPIYSWSWTLYDSVTNEYGEFHRGWANVAGTNHCDSTGGTVENVSALEKTTSSSYDAYDCNTTNTACTTCAGASSTIEKRGLNDKMWGDRYWTGGYYTENFGWAMHLINTVKWTTWPPVGGNGAPVIGGIRDNVTDSEIFPPKIDHLAWSASLQSVAPYSQYDDYQTEYDNLSQYKQTEESKFLLCKCLSAADAYPGEGTPFSEGQEIIVRKPDACVLSAGERNTKRVCPEYFKNDIIYVVWQPVRQEDGITYSYVDININARKIHDYSEIVGLHVYTDVFPTPYIPIETPELIPPHNLDTYSYNCYDPIRMGRGYFESDHDSEAGGKGQKGVSCGTSDGGLDGEKGNDGEKGGDGDKGTPADKGEKGGHGDKGPPVDKGYRGSVGEDSSWTTGTVDESGKPQQWGKGNVEVPLGEHKKSGVPALTTIKFEKKKIGVCAEKEGAQDDRYHPEYKYFYTYISGPIIKS